MAKYKKPAINDPVLPAPGDRNIRGKYFYTRKDKQGNKHPDSKKRRKRVVYITDPFVGVQQLVLAEAKIGEYAKVDELRPTKNRRFRDPVTKKFSKGFDRSFAVPAKFVYEPNMVVPKYPKDVTEFIAKVRSKDKSIGSFVRDNGKGEFISNSSVIVKNMSFNGQRIRENIARRRDKKIITNVAKYVKHKGKFYLVAGHSDAISQYMATNAGLGRKTLGIVYELD